MYLYYLLYFFAIKTTSDSSLLYIICNLIEEEFTSKMT